VIPPRGYPYLTFARLSHLWSQFENGGNFHEK
jgi:hypothetical protein